MTRRRRRDIERAIDNLAEALEPDPEAVVVIYPDHALGAYPTLGDDVPAEIRDRVDDAREGIYVTEEHEDGIVFIETTVPLHRKQFSGVTLLSKSEVTVLWLAVCDDPTVREAERDLREELGKPIPPILESACEEAAV